MEYRLFKGYVRNIEKVLGSGGIRTHASEETGALNQRLRPLGHATGLMRGEVWVVEVWGDEVTSGGPRSRD